jgi:hypothetical protein
MPSASVCNTVDHPTGAAIPHGGWVEIWSSWTPPKSSVLGRLFRVVSEPTRSTPNGRSQISPLGGSGLSCAP